MYEVGYHDWRWLPENSRGLGKGGKQAAERVLVTNRASENPSSGYVPLRCVCVPYDYFTLRTNVQGSTPTQPPSPCSPLFLMPSHVPLP